MVFGINVLNRIRRGNENVCYAPARAKLPDPSVGSYKLIQPKDEQPSCPKPPARPALPDLLMPTTENRPSYPTPEYITRKSFDRLLSLPLEYSKKSSLDAELTPPPVNGAPAVCDDSRREKIAPADKIEDVEEKTTKDAPRIETCAPVSEDNSCDKTAAMPEQKYLASNDVDVKVSEDAVVLAQTVVVEEAPAPTPAVVDAEVALKLPEVTRWSETLPVHEEFTQARRRLLQALPTDHQLRHLISLSQDQRSPIDFIRDFFDEVPSIAAPMLRTDDSTAKDPVETAAEAETQRKDGAVHENALIELKCEVEKCSERLVGALEAATEATAAAMSSNDQLGATVLQRLPAPLSTKFTSHHTEVYHISSLMAALSARLARTYDDTERLRPEGKQIEELRTKREKLEDQLQEARSLKENIDARACTLAAKISDALDAAAFRDYRLFMAVKPRLIIRARHLHYRLEYERERLNSLQLSLNER